MGQAYVYIRKYQNARGDGVITSRVIYKILFLAFNCQEFDIFNAALYCTKWHNVTEYVNH